MEARGGAVMGEKIVKKIRGMGWMKKISLVLIFALLFSTFMYQGWYKPMAASAAVTNVSSGTLVNGWAHPSTGTTGPWTIANGTFSCGTGSNRLLVAVVTGETATAAAAAVTGTMGTGNNFTTATSTASSRTQAWIGYLTESQIVAGGTNSVVLTNASGQAWSRGR